jgi:glycosyltransferase involved in cell wall biosynthesis
MAVGMPVLSSDTFGAREMVRDGVDGRIVPVGDARATAEAMVAFTGNADQLAAMGRAGQARVAGWLSPDRVAGESVAVYRAAIARN